MSMMPVGRVTRNALTLVLLSAGLGIGGCSVLKPPPAEPVRTYALDARATGVAVYPQSDRTVLVAVPRAYPGLDTPGMTYVRRPHARDYYATSQWVATPSRMLQPLLANALQATGYFHDVTLAPAPGGVGSDVRLDTEIIRLQQDFTVNPSIVHVALRAQVMDLAHNRILATREFEAERPAAGQDAYGGVVAVNEALAGILRDLAAFTVDSLQ